MLAMIAALQKSLAIGGRITNHRRAGCRQNRHTGRIRSTDFGARMGLGSAIAPGGAQGYGSGEFHVPTRFSR